MKSHKDAQLRQVVEALQARWGTQVIGQGAEPQAVTYLRTGFEPLDDLLGGGVPQGRVTELTGQPTSGMTTLALRVMASAQHQGEAVVYLDLAAAFDPDYAQRCGVNPADLILVRPPFQIALEMLFDIVAMGLPGVVVLNTVPNLSPQQSAALGAVLARLHPLLTRTRCALLIVSSGSAISPSTTLRLQVEREQWLVQHDIQGYQAMVTVLKHKPGNEGQQVRIQIRFDDSEEESPS